MFCVKNELYLFSCVFNIVCNVMKLIYQLELSCLVHQVGGVQGERTAIRLKSSFDEKIDLESFIFTLVSQQFQWMVIFLFLFLSVYQFYRMIDSLKINIENFGINQQILLRFVHLIQVHQHQRNRLHTIGSFTSYKCHKVIVYTMMVGTLIINGLVYTYNVGLPVTAYVGFKTNICDLPNNISDGLEVDYV